MYNEGSFALERKRLLLNNYEVAEHEEVTTIALKPYETKGLSHFIIKRMLFEHLFMKKINFYCKVKTLLLK